MCLLNMTKILHQLKHLRILALVLALPVLSSLTYPPTHLAHAAPPVTGEMVFVEQVRVLADSQFSRGSSDIRPSSFDTDCIQAIHSALFKPESVTKILATELAEAGIQITRNRSSSRDDQLRVYITELNCDYQEKVRNTSAPLLLFGRKKRTNKIKLSIQAELINGRTGAVDRSIGLDSIGESGESSYEFYVVYSLKDKKQATPEELLRSAFRELARSLKDEKV